MSWGITMTDKDRDNVMLDDLFRAARGEARSQGASPDLLARVLADAETHQPAPQALASVAPRGRGRWAQFLSAIGGWPSVSGLAAATVAGVWIGFAATSTVLPYGLTALSGQGAESYLSYMTAGDFSEEGDM